MPGVGLWRPKVNPPVWCVVVPGNVGNSRLLVDLLSLLGV
jgi:hypothetical protein